MNIVAITFKVSGTAARLNLFAASLHWGGLITGCHSEDIISDPSNMTSDPNPLDSDSPFLFNILSPRGSFVL